MKKTVLLFAVMTLTSLFASAGEFKTLIYCHESQPVPNEKFMYAVEIQAEKGRAANWISVSEVDAYDYQKKNVVLRQLIEEEAGSIEKGIVVHKISIKAYTRLVIEYPYKNDGDLGYLPSALVFLVDGQYKKIPLKCSHLVKPTEEIKF